MLVIFPEYCWVDCPSYICLLEWQIHEDENTVEMNISSNQTAFFFLLIAFK